MRRIANNQNEIVVNAFTFINFNGVYVLQAFPRLTVPTNRNGVYFNERTYTDECTFQCVSGAVSKCLSFQALIAI